MAFINISAALCGMHRKCNCNSRLPYAMHRQIKASSVCRPSFKWALNWTKNTGKTEKKNFYHCKNFHNLFEIYRAIEAYDQRVMCIMNCIHSFWIYDTYVRHKNTDWLYLYLYCFEQTKHSTKNNRYNEKFPRRTNARVPYVILIKKGICFLPHHMGSFSMRSNWIAIQNGTLFRLRVAPQ